jgi:glycosyltransferase involved in cell wall biosynthesis
MRIALLSGAFPPQFDGIGDYTWWLSQAFAEMGHEIIVLTSFAPIRHHPPNVEVIPCFHASRSQTLREALKQVAGRRRFDWLIVQYNPFSFGPRGFAPGLIAALRTADLPIALMFHETFAVPLWPWQQIVMRLWQYPQFVCLARAGQCNFVSTERWLAQVRRWARAPSYLMPVGSNLPLCQLTKAQARSKLGLSPDALILGVFGFAHGSKRTDWIGMAARAIHGKFPQTQILSIGELGQRLRDACGDVPLHDHGFLPGQEASLRLRAMDLFLAPFSDGISGRRGSAIAAFQHGVPVCSTFRGYTDRFLREVDTPALRLTPADNKSLFIESAREQAELCLQQPDLGRDLIRFYETHFDWPVLAHRTMQGLLQSSHA